MNAPNLHRWGALGAALWALTTTNTAVAQARYPERPVKVIMAVSAGSSSDLAMRVIGEAMSRHLRQPLVVDNRPGAGGVLTASAVSQALPDGYTIGLITNGHVINPATIRNLPFDPLRDFTPITLLAQGGMVLLVNASLPVQSFSELVALAKRKPGDLTYGSSGSGGLLHLYTAQIEHEAGIQLRHIPYKGLTPMVQDLVGGQIDIGMAGLPSTMTFIANGKLRALAVTSKARMPGLPKVPTLAEAGLAGYDNNGWIVLIGPRGLPTEIVATLHAATKAALSDPKVAETLEKASMDQVASSPEETARILRTDLERHLATAKRVGVKPE